MEQEIKIGQREPIIVMSRRLPVRMSDIGGAISGGFGEVYGYIGAQGVEPQGPPFVIYHDMPHAEDPFDVEICAPVARPMDAAPGWEVRELPAGMFATYVHVGPYETLGTSYAALTAWVGEHGLVIAGPPREVYLSPPENPPEEIRTIIEFPVAEVAVPVPAS